MEADKVHKNTQKTPCLYAVDMFHYASFSEKV